jgi:acetolactate decarboxylase
MNNTKGLLFLGLLFFLSCDLVVKDSSSEKTYPDVISVAAMKDVMWKGELQGKISLDSIKNKKGLYGLGPNDFLKGEIIINNGQTYLSQVTSDSTMVVKNDTNIQAPFFVYTNVNSWYKIQLPDNIKSINDLELFIDSKTKDKKRPLAFKLSGTIERALIHIQNLPDGSKVTSPKEAHQGQVDYSLKNEEVEIISTEHQGIFTHHDSYIHMHLITQDKKQMGHLDDVSFKNMTLFLPKS